MGRKIVSLVPQEKFWGPEEILSPKKWGSRTNLDKTGLSLQKKFGFKQFFLVQIKLIDLITTLCLIEV